MERWKASSLLAELKACSRTRNLKQGRQAHDKALELGCSVLAELKACSRTRNLKQGRQAHDKALELGCSVHVTNALINMYSKCGSMLDARQLFDKLKHPDLASWNILIRGYADNGQGVSALDLFTKMRRIGPAPNSLTFVAAMKACSSLAPKEGQAYSRLRGVEIHKLAVESGCHVNIFVQNTCIDMYCKCGSMVDAHQVFDSIIQPNVVSWTTLILGYADAGQGIAALDVFSEMRSRGAQPSALTFVASLKACSYIGGIKGRDRGKGLHTLAIKNSCSSDIYVQSTLIDMYAKCGSIVEGRQVFDCIKHPNVVSWTALMLGYVENGEGLTALNLFREMKNRGPAPNALTYTAALKACGLVGELEFGRVIHSELMRGNHLDGILVSCLVDFYATCGSMVEAQSMFDMHPRSRITVTWNALMTAFSNRGDHGYVFKLFEKMQEEGCRPNAVTFICILTCCNHGGLVEKGKEFFDAMPTKYGVKPATKHYTCMVDIFGRAKKLDGAMALLQTMPYSYNDVIWTSILAACHKWKNVEIGRLAFQSWLAFNDKDPAAYVLMRQLLESGAVIRFRREGLELDCTLQPFPLPTKTSSTSTPVNSFHFGGNTIQSKMAP